MYLVEGPKSPNREMTDWEAQHCPWYLDMDSWSIPFDKEEKKVLDLVAKAQPVPVVINVGKNGDEVKSLTSAKEMQDCVSSRVVYVDKTRKKVGKTGKGAPVDGMS